MFGMIIWGVDFEQDLRPLIKAFYPDCDFTVRKEEIGDNLRDIAEWTAFLECSFPKKEREEFFPDYAFYLMESGGYFAVWHGGDWILDEFHRIDDPDEHQMIFRDDILKKNAIRRKYRNALMRPLYRILERVSGVHLPWGILTGVRPTKQVLEQMEAGVSESEIARFMREEYFCTD